MAGGLQQAIDYARDLDVKFAYSSNGDGFYEHDLITGEEREIKMDEFPSPDDLWARYRSESGFSETKGVARDAAKVRIGNIWFTIKFERVVLTGGPLYSFKRIAIFPMR